MRMSNGGRTVKDERKSKVSKAYKDLEFLNSPDARTIRILSEFLEPQRRFRRAGIQDTVVFFGSARIRPRAESAKRLKQAKEIAVRSRRPGVAMLRELQVAEAQYRLSRYYEDAVELARLIAEWSKTFENPSRFVVCSGGGPGIMEAANKGAIAGGGKSIGLNISLPFEQFANQYLTPELTFEFHYFFMRKFWFAYLSKALIVFPGGFGTLDELMEMLTLLQTKKITKQICVVMYGSEYWKQVINFQELVNNGMVEAEDLALFRMIDTPKEAFEHIRGFLMERHLAKGRGKK
jgi:uncharacterized protein (TIGR00730 family)